MSSILDGGARVEGGAFTSYLRGASKTMELTESGGSICASAQAPARVATSRVRERRLQIKYACWKVDWEIPQYYEGRWFQKKPVMHVHHPTL